MPPLRVHWFFFRRKLWLQIIEHQASGSGVQNVAKLISEAQDVGLQDVLPHIADSMPLESLRDEIDDYIQLWEEKVRTHYEEMDGFKDSCRELRKDVERSEYVSINIAADQVCEICGKFAGANSCYVFPCRHCFHEACLPGIVLHTLEPESRERWDCLIALQAAEKLQNSSSALISEVQEELDSLIADDCPLCGRIMVQTIQKPFVDFEEQSVIESWAI